MTTYGENLHKKVEITTALIPKEPLSNIKLPHRKYFSLQPG